MGRRTPPGWPRSDGELLAGFDDRPDGPPGGRAAARGVAGPGTRPWSRSPGPAPTRSRPSPSAVPMTPDSTHRLSLVHHRRPRPSATAGTRPPPWPSICSSATVLAAAGPVRSVLDVGTGTRGCWPSPPPPCRGRVRWWGSTSTRPRCRDRRRQRRPPTAVDDHESRPTAVADSPGLGPACLGVRSWWWPTSSSRSNGSWHRPLAVGPEPPAGTLITAGYLEADEAEIEALHQHRPRRSGRGHDRRPSPAGRLAGPPVPAGQALSERPNQGFRARRIVRGVRAERARASTRVAVRVSWIRGL